MDLKLIGCIHHSVRSFDWYFRGHLRSSWGYSSIKGRMELKLGGCSHYSDGIFLLVPLGSSEVIMGSPFAFIYGTWM